MFNPPTVTTGEATLPDYIGDAVTAAGVASGVADALVAWMVRGLENDRYAKLDGAPVDPATRARLARVFTDVGVAIDGRDDESERRPGVLARLLGEDSLLLQWGRGRWGEARWGGKHLSRFVLVGGPGQGKSTLAQQLTQRHRAEWLKPRKESLDEIARATLDDIATCAEEDSLATVALKRLPFLVPLGTLSRWRATNSGSEPRLVDFLVEQVNDAGGTVTATQLMALLRTAPWLLVLDGLDEVPASAGRRETLALAEHFVRELSDTRGMLVGTTRPQGYQGDFGEVAEMRLAEFSTKRAIAYAKRLLEDWFPAALDEQRRLLERLTNASQDANTARLLGTPLHVSILTALLHRTPVVPRERWQLFHDFFGAIYQREVDRPHPYAELLKKWRRYIEPMHHIAGLHLQALGEHAEGAEALLTRAELVRIVDAQLQVAKFSDERRRELVHDIVEAASDRLVLLAQVRDGRYGFTLRSIQEFMAAEALTSGAHEAIERRVQRLAPLPYWRNVVLLAVSKLFSPGQTALAPLIDALTIGVCDRLAERGDGTTVYVPGDDAAFATDLLAEGSVSVDPGVTGALVDRALRIVDQPDGERVRKLGDALAKIAHDKDCAQELEAVARPLLDARMRSEAFGAWDLVVGIADHGVGWASDLASQRWPIDPNERRDLARNFGRTPGRLRPWIVERMLQDPEAFGPMEWDPFVFRAPASTSLSRSYLKWARSRRNYIAGAVVDAPVRFLLRAVDSATAPEEAQAEMARHRRWHPLLWLARFSSSPSSVALAEALTSFAQEATPDELRRAMHDGPWPVAACLAWAETREELRGLAEAAARGELGDSEAWRSAEARWESEPAALAENAPHGEALPFTGAIKDRGRVPWAARIRLTNAGDPDYYEPPVTDDRFISRIMDLVVHALDASPRRVVAVWAGRMLDAVLKDGWSVPAVVSASHLRRIVIASGTNLGTLLHLARPEESNALVELLDAERARIYIDETASTERMSELLMQHPGSSGLLHFALEALIWGDLLSSISIPASTFEHSDRLPPKDRAAVAAFEFATKRTKDIEPLASQLLASDLAVQAALAVAHQDPARSATLATALLGLLPASESELRASCIRVLVKAAALQRNDLLDPAVWKELALPRPSPPEPVSTSPVVPVHIEHLRVENVRAFETFDLPVDSSGEHGAWVVLLGENGTGKSTLLRAVTLALAEPDYATTMFTESASRAAWRRDGAKSARATVSLHGQSYTITLDMGETGREALLASSDPPNGSARERPFLVAYGCRRGAADGGRDQKVNIEPLDGIGTLFDAPGRALVIAEAWLKDLALAQLQNEPGTAHLYDVVREVLVGAEGTEGILPGVRSMRIAGGTVWFDGPDVGNAPLAALSDGYITTAGWVIDLMARWIHHRRTRREAVSRDFTKEMRGVVLLDEIDLHLHPRWQRDLIPTVRRVFPKLTFIVTTHNPLTVIGAREGEVFVLRRRKDAAGVEARRLHVPVGMRADQVLTGEWFGLATTLDPETFELWEKHYRALRSGKKAGDPDLRELERELARRLGTYASTSLDRIALDVAAEVMGDRPKDLSAAEREAARASILEFVKARSGGTS